MAELNVERKKHNVWPWIIGALAVLLAVWAIAQWNDDDDAMVAQTNVEAIERDAFDDAFIETEPTVVEETSTAADAATEDEYAP